MKRLSQLTVIGALIILITVFSGCELFRSAERPEPAPEIQQEDETEPPDTVRVEPEPDPEPETGPREPVPIVDGLDVTFRLSLDREVETVFLTGWFNGWTPDDPQFRMQQDDDGVWSITVTLDPGRYEYKFVVDGRLLADAEATEQEPDEGGGFKSLVTVTGETD